MSNAIYFNSFVSGLAQGQINLVSGDIRIALLDSSYVFDGDAHENFDDILSDEIVGTGYTSGGKALAGKALTSDPDNLRTVYTANSLTWAASTITGARYAVALQYSGDFTTSPLLFLIDFGEDKSSGAGNFVIDWDPTDGIIYFE